MKKIIALVLAIGLIGCTTTILPIQVELAEKECMPHGGLKIIDASEVGFYENLDSRNYYVTVGGRCNDNMKFKIGVYIPKK